MTGGSTIRLLTQQSQCQNISVTPVGDVTIIGSKQSQVEEAVRMIQNLTRKPQLNEVYEGMVTLLLLLPLLK